MKTKVKDFVFQAKEDILANPKASIATGCVVATGIAITTANSVFLTKVVFTKTATGVVATFVKAGLVAKTVTLLAGFVITGLAGYAVYNYIKDNDSLFTAKINIK